MFGSKKTAKTFQLRREKIITDIERNLEFLKDVSDEVLRQRDENTLIIADLQSENNGLNKILLANNEATEQIHQVLVKIK